MEVVGEEGVSLNDMITYLKSELYEFSYLQQNAFDKEDAYCSLERQIHLFTLINRIFDTHFHFESRDAARSYFLELQNELKNMNFMPFKSERYFESLSSIQKKVEHATKVKR
jgi:V/A-type H+-transporting ATPase subunit A